MLHKEAQGRWRWVVNEESGCGEAVGREEDVQGPEQPEKNLPLSIYRMGCRTGSHLEKQTSGLNHKFESLKPSLVQNHPIQELLELCGYCKTHN